MSQIGGLRIVPDEHMVERVEARVPGGYMNRWLIRATVTRPLRTARMWGNTLFMHPTLIEQFKKELTK